MNLIIKDAQGNKIATIANGSATTILCNLHSNKSKYKASVNNEHEVVFTVHSPMGVEMPNGNDVTLFLAEKTTITCKN
jgi:hypothetical protein